MATPPQRTGAAWKVLTLVGLVFVTWGMVVGIPALHSLQQLEPGTPSYSEASNTFAKGLALFLAGLLELLIARLGVWWFYE
jgi:hypothetical protein